MRRSGILFAALWAVLAAACVSSTTTSNVNFEEDDDAALQFYSLGARYYRNGSFELARDRLVRALEFEPRMADAHSLLALTYEQLEIPRLATEHHELAVRYEPRNLDARNHYAVFLCNQRRFDEARKQFDKGINDRENDNSEIMLTNAGVCMVQKPDLVKAEEYFREAITRKPRFGEALIQMSALKFQTGEHLHARAFLQRYLATNAPSAAVLYLGVQIEQKLGDDSASSDYMDQILRDFPESAEARHIRESG